MSKQLWGQVQAIQLCKEIEAIAPKYGAHVALTGGCLYKEGARKDVDIMFYRIRQVAKIDRENLFIELTKLGLFVVRGFDWCYKAKYMPFDANVDLFFPEHDPDHATADYTGSKA
jgi:hypothetical protein